MVLEGRYELVRHLATGGMGEVYEAHDQILARNVAVKVFRSTGPADRRRFEAEVTTLAALNHPGLVQVFDAGEHDGSAFVVLELVDGPNLRDILAERGALPPSEVATLGVTVAEALAYVHEQGVVHRDVTPANVLCGPDGRPRLADFGIARLVDSSRITAVATTIGTAAYMAPEQVEGADVTPAADIYAFGLVLLEALTGRREFDGPLHESAVARLARDPDVMTGVPQGWQPLLVEMTSRSPAARPSATAVAARLATLAAVPDPVAMVVAAPGADAVDGHAATAALAVGGGTTVMPAALSPAAPTPASPAHREETSRRVLWLVLVVVALVVWAGLASRNDASFDPDPADTPTTVVATTVTTAPPTTVAPPPPQQAEPGAGKADQGKDKGKGGDNGKGKSKDDD